MASASSLRIKLIKLGVKKHECEKCGITEWLTERISLELHHVDGNPKNNEIDNLQILCPNCHSQTHNYRGRNKRKKERTVCIDCGVPISSSGIRCKKHSAIHREKMFRATGLFPECRNNTKIKWPSVANLKSRLLNQSCRSLSKELGVSDQAIYKHIKKHRLVG